MYQRIIEELRVAYDGSAVERERGEKIEWKITERQLFLDMLLSEGKHSLLEIGAGTGQDAQFFQQQGLEVICTDLSPEMVKFCRQKGLPAYVMDFLQLDFPPASFAAIYALNCLLHVPSQDLPTVLGKIRELLQPGGLFYLGVYGGSEHEGTMDNDQHTPRRFFSYHTDAFMRQVTQKFFEPVYFKAVALPGDLSFHFQSIILRKP